MEFYQEPMKVEIDGSPEPYLKANDLARMLSIKEGTIRDWYRRYPDFPAIRLPGGIRVRASEVRAWLDKLAGLGRNKIGDKELERFLMPMKAECSPRRRAKRGVRR